MTALHYDPFDPALIADPYPTYARLRDEAPVYRVPERDYWVLSRHADVTAAFRDHATFSSAKGVGPEPVWAPALITTDPPRHTFLRRLVTKPFTPRAIEERWADRVTELTRPLVDALVRPAGGPGPVDVVSGLNWPLPVQVIAEMIGVPAERMDDFKHWSDELCNGIGGHLDPEMMRRTTDAYIAAFGYFTEVIPERRAHPGDDLLSMLCASVDGADGESLDDMEIAHFCILLLIAGNETTTNLLGAAFLAFRQFPDVWERLRADRSLVPAAVEEFLRWGSPTQALFRQTTQPVELHGVTIGADERVMLNIAAANRDDRVFDDPDTVRLDRDRNEHVAFGNGIHLCLGAPLARLEGRVVLETLLESCRELRFDGDVAMSDNFMLRGPLHLAVECVPA